MSENVLAILVVMRSKGDKVILWLQNSYHDYQGRK